MSFKNSVNLFFIFIAVGFIAYIGTHNGYYPVAIINSSVISARAVERDYLAAYTYFKNAALVYGVDPNSLDTVESVREIRRATLDKLITDRLIYNELNNRLEKEEFLAIAERNIQNLLKDNSTILDASEKLYGLEFLDFKELVLIPQAYKEILEGRMFLTEESFDNWINEAKEGALVIILNPDLQWEDGEVRLQ